LRVFANGIDADEKVPGEDVLFAIIEGDDVGKIVMLEILHVHIQDIIIRAENDVDGTKAPHFAPGNHLQPAVVLQLLLQIKADILLKVAYHGQNFCKFTSIIGIENKIFYL
jgi:hypothetical protein